MLTLTLRTRNLQLMMMQITIPAMYLTTLLQNFVTREHKQLNRNDAKKIVEAIINALPLKQQQWDSIKSFEEWLRWAKDFVITDVRMNDIWPTFWSETEDVLRKAGYESTKHDYIRISEQHAREWDIMESPLDKCRHCREPGTINYYYMGLSSKVKRWYGNKVMHEVICLITGGRRNTGFTVLNKDKLKAGQSKRNCGMAPAFPSTHGFLIRKWNGYSQSSTLQT